MRNKFLSRTTRQTNSRLLGECQQFEDSIVPQTIGRHKSKRAAAAGADSLADKLCQSEVLREKNPESNCSTCKKKSSPTNRSFLKSTSTPRVLSAKVVAIEWQQPDPDPEPARNAIHSSNRHSLFHLERAQTAERKRREQQRAIALSISSINSTYCKQSKKVPSFLKSRANPSRSKHYNRMFQLHPGDDNRELSVKSMFAFPLEANFTAKRTHQAP